MLELLLSLPFKIVSRFSAARHFLTLTYTTLNDSLIAPAQMPTLSTAPPGQVLYDSTCVENHELIIQDRRLGLTFIFHYVS